MDTALPVGFCPVGRSSLSRVLPVPPLDSHRGPVEPAHNVSGGCRHQESVFTLEVPGKPISPHNSHLSYQSASAWPPLAAWLGQKKRFFLERRWPPAEETPSCDTGLAAAHFLNEPPLAARGRGVDHGGAYKYSEGTRCIPSLLILLTFP